MINSLSSSSSSFHAANMQRMTYEPEGPNETFKTADGRTV